MVHSIRVHLLVLQYVEADITIEHISMLNFCNEFDLGRAEGVIIWEMNGQFEHSTSIRAVALYSMMTLENSDHAVHNKITKY